MSRIKASFYGMNPPFLGGQENILSRQEDDRLIKNDILQLLLTIPGERVMRPTFGVQLRSFVFEQMTDADIVALQSEIAEAIRVNEPRVNVESIDITRNDDKNRIQIKIVARLKKDPKKELVIETFITQRS